MKHRLVLLVAIISCYVYIASAIRYELEDLHVIGAASCPEVHQLGDFSGSGYVNFAPSLSEDEESIIIFSINIPEDNKYLFTINYASNVSSEGALAVHINGIQQFVSTLPTTPNKWTLKQEAVVFRQGLNSVILKGADLYHTLSVDFIEVEGALPFATRGATLPYFEIEAEAATTNGQKIGPTRDLYKLPTEASGRVAVQINQGQYVEFTLSASANAITVRFSIPDTADGSGQKASLDVYVDGTKVTTLAVSSIYSWAYGSYPFTKHPGDGNPHHFYDETRGMFGKTVAKGSKVRIVAVNPITYTIDLADFYTVPDPYTMPSGYISITDNGADPTGVKDSTAAITTTLSTASKQGKGVWMPKGTFLVNSRFTIPNKMTVRGAGPWYTTVKATVNHGVGFFGNWAPNPSVAVQLIDFAILGDTNVRDDSAPDSGVGGALTGGTLIQNLWIEHTKCGMWLDGPFDGFHVTGTTIRNTYADGINFHTGITNSVVEQSMLRNLGDDGLAVWAEKTTDAKNVFKFNTIQVPVLANAIALYGGQDNSVTDNYVADSICDGGGLQIGNRYNAVPVAGTTTFARNTIVRCGAPSRFGPQDCGSIWVFQEQGSLGGTITFTDNESHDSSYSAVTFWNGGFNGNVVFSGLNVYGGPYVMEVNSASGTIPCDHVVAHNLTLNNGGIHSCAGLIFQDKGGNSGWDMNHDHQHCN